MHVLGQKRLIEMNTSKALIVSYSYSGHTHQIARAIQTLTGADWCELHPWQPYPVEFPALLRQVRQETKTGYRPRLLPGALSPQDYPVIFVGSPNWCGTIAPPLAAWLAGKDWSGKVVFPFYSHCGGALGNIRADIAALCPGAEVREALGILQVGQTNLLQEIQSWLETAGIPLQMAAALSF